MKKTIVINENGIKALSKLNEEVFFIDYFKDIKDFLKGLLTKPYETDVTKTFKDKGITKDELIKKLKNIGILTSKENIIEVPIDEAKETNVKEIEGKKRAKHTISYKVRKNNFMEKIKELYKELFAECNTPKPFFKDEDSMKKVILDGEDGETYRLRGGIKESASANHKFYDYLNEYDEYYVLCKFFEEQKKGEIWLPLINPNQYQTALDEFVKYGELIHFPKDKVYQWMGIIMKNTALLDAFTNIGGHSEGIDTDAFVDVFFEGDWDEYENYKKSIDEDDDFGAEWEYLDNMGFDDWSRLPDDSDAVSDYGLSPLMKLIAQYDEDMKAEDVLVLINKILDVYHQRGDLSSMFISGGSRTLDRISNPQFHGTF